jgi:hypothetical protein
LPPEIDQCTDRMVYQSPAWLDFVAETQNAEKVVAELKSGGQILGYFTGLIVCKFGLRILGSPFPGWTTSYMGLNITASVPREEALRALENFAFNDLGCVHLEMMDRFLTVEQVESVSFKYKMQGTYEIDLTQNEEALLAGMSKTCRWSIRKSEKNGVSIEESHDLSFADDYHAQLIEVFAKQGLAPPYSVERIRSLIRNLLPTGMLLLLRAYDPEKRCIATGIFPGMNRSMHFWGGASWRQFQSLLPNEAIQWYAMKYWKNRGMQVYDMEGLRDYKRKYGGKVVYVPWLRKSKYFPIGKMRDWAQKLVAVRQHVLGRLQQNPGAAQ